MGIDHDVKALVPRFGFGQRYELRFVPGISPCSRLSGPGRHLQAGAGGKSGRSTNAFFPHPFSVKAGRGSHTRLANQVQKELLQDEADTEADLGSQTPKTGSLVCAVSCRPSPKRLKSRRKHYLRPNLHRALKFLPPAADTAVGEPERRAPL